MVHYYFNCSINYLKWFLVNEPNLSNEEKDVIKLVLNIKED